MFGILTSQNKVYRRKIFGCLFNFHFHYNIPLNIKIINTIHERTGLSGRFLYPALFFFLLWTDLKHLCLKVEIKPKTWYLLRTKTSIDGLDVRLEGITLGVHSQAKVK